MRFAVYQVSRRGGREKNEDRMGYCYTRDAGLFALADGMGGHPQGEVAAHLALESLASLFQRDAQSTLRTPVRFLEEGILTAHRRLQRYAQDHELSDTPRTTVVAAVVQQGQVWWAHCGDSRLYLVRNGALLTRTRDHSYLELQEALGRADALPEHVNRNVLFTCLGSPGKPMIDIGGPVALQRGDRLLLCSDGLWGTVNDVEITHYLSTHAVADAVPELVEQALRLGGVRCDNVTALALEWEGEQDDSDAADSISTESLSQQDFASTIQTSGAIADVQLDDAEIDRAVREIQEAIRRARELKP
ncbi:PP2C family protein-serine/threonine phosphatase [Roseateles sp. BYS180W]|uniref:PP2C family protein-serine/threonine phosphatase n=1 Tax=Roseateles rivi TaxID=3299028 RepID=A0ABW7FUV1_9BURK